MQFKLALFFTFLLLFGQTVAFGFQKFYAYTIKGRVVDDYLKPVANASITIKSPEYKDGCIIENFSTDNDGNFVIKRELEKPVSEWTIFVTDASRLPKDTNELLDVHIGNVLSTEYNPLLAGQKITVVENQITDLGDVRLQIRQFPLLVQLLDVNGQPLIKEDKDNKFYPWWVVRDPRGDIVAESGNSAVHYRLSQSAVMIALPEGTWSLGVAGSNGSSLKTSQIVTVKSSDVPQRIALRLKKAAQIKFEGRKKAFALTVENARREIEKMGFSFDQNSFENRVLHGNDQAVALFLDAGMNPNVLTRNADFLMSALSRPRILKLLLEAGANVNRKINGGITPLIYAAGWSIVDIETIQMLLDAGADVTPKNDEGHDALYYSQINDDRPELAPLLKSYLNKKK